jgi:alpha-galactosidase
MSVNEDRTHFTMWCMLAAPLIAGNDIQNMSKETKAILTNKEAIAVDQDSLGIQGFKYSVSDSVETWFKPLSKDAWALCFLNRASVSKEIKFVWTENPVSDDFSKREIDFSKTTFKIRNLWTKKEMGKTSKTLKADLPGHDVLLLKLTPVK